MVQDQGNNIMTKINILRLVLLFVLPVMLTACSDKGNASEEEAGVMEQEKFDSQPANPDGTTNTSDVVDIQDLMNQVAQAEEQAAKYGFVWSTTDGIIKNAYAKAKEGNENEAKILFQEAILQFKLSIEQAKYADQHWKLLIPEND